MSSNPTYEELAHKVEELKKKALQQETILDQLGPIFNYSLDLIASGNLQGYFTKVNPSCKRILDYTEEELLQTPYLDFVHPDDYQTAQNSLEAGIKGEKEIYITIRLQCKNGSYRWIEWRVQVFVHDNLFIAVGRDITDNKQLEKGLYLSTRRYQNIIQTSNDGFLQADEKGNITDCNTAYLEMSGYTRDELLSMHISDLDAYETPKETEEHVRKIIEQGWSRFERVHKRKDGITFTVEVRTTFIPQENLFVAFVKDITERKQVYAKLQESEERFRQLAENIQEVFWLGSTDWQAVYYISPAYETIWGRTRESLYIDPLSWLDSVHEEDLEKVRSAISQNIDETTQIIVFPEYRIRNQQGEIRWIQARGFPIRDESRHVYRVAGIAEDITERKLDEIERVRLVRELQQAFEEIRTLKGFLPVCASCRMIRNENGRWLSFETYIEENSDAEITHSICPVCALKMYPDLVDKDGKVKKK